MNKINRQLKAFDIFSGIGGLTLGLKKAGFDVRGAVEIDPIAAKTFKLNHRKTIVLQKDIRQVSTPSLKKILGNERLALLAGCPPCQGFSSVRRLNKKQTIRDDRNKLILEYLRLVKGLKPLTIMMENVSGIKNYYLFNVLLKELKKLNYNIDYRIVNVKDYGVPQRRRRMVLVGSKLGEISVAAETNEKLTVRDAIGKLKLKNDPLHDTTEKRTPKIAKMISKIPKDGGSRKDLPEEYELECHTKKNVGFNDIYGRLRWDDYSTTITGGCLSPSKGRFLHPEENRAITAREAALLQSFDINYKFPKGISKTTVSTMIGNALPPKFSYIQSKNIMDHLKEHLG
ncbi:MAG: DNA (cytosine-5-)-methyltransferase [Ignavibacteria bacterium RBG_16_35_7]|nr:MAG: DNA (cytosine-5-)-methyltransferase [Ignavibacteria bacterium RBG_16_35_7]